MKIKCRLLPLLVFFAVLFFFCGCGDKMNETRTEEILEKETIVETGEEESGKTQDLPEKTSSVSTTHNQPESSTTVTTTTSGTNTPATSTEKVSVSTTKKVSVSTSQTNPPSSTTKWPFGGGIELPEDEF